MEKMEEPMKSYKRINVIGTSGSGKSTLCEKISKKINAPHISLDQLFWAPNWKGTPDEVFFPRLEKALSVNSWVLDGKYERTTAIKWKKVDVVIWIDLPFWLTLYQAVTRAFKRAWSKEELWPGTGNCESFRRSFFSRDSVILWTINTHHKTRETYSRVINDLQYKHIEFIRLRSRAQVNQFIEVFNNGK